MPSYGGFGANFAEYARQAMPQGTNIGIAGMAEAQRRRELEAEIKRNEAAKAFNQMIAQKTYEANAANLATDNERMAREDLWKRDPNNPDYQATQMGIKRDEAYIKSLTDPKQFAPPAFNLDQQMYHLASNPDALAQATPQMQELYKNWSQKQGYNPNSGTNAGMNDSQMETAARMYAAKRVNPQTGIDINTKETFDEIYQKRLMELRFGDPQQLIQGVPREEPQPQLQSPTQQQIQPVLQQAPTQQGGLGQEKPLTEEDVVNSIRASGLNPQDIDVEAILRDYPHLNRAKLQQLGVQ